MPALETLVLQPLPTLSATLHSSCQLHPLAGSGSMQPPAPAAPRFTAPLPTATSQHPPSPAVQEEDGRASGERAGRGQEGRMPVGRPPVCPRLILAAFSVAWQSGPVAPAVILRFLGHCHTGSAAKWGAGGAGAASRAKGREGDVRWQRGRDGGVCTGRQECPGVCPDCFPPTSGSVGPLPWATGSRSMPVAFEGLWGDSSLRAAPAPPTATCDAAVPHRPRGPTMTHSPASSEDEERHSASECPEGGSESDSSPDGPGRGLRGTRGQGSGAPGNLASSAGGLQGRSMSVPEDAHFSMMVFRIGIPDLHQTVSEPAGGGRGTGPGPHPEASAAGPRFQALLPQPAPPT